MANRIASVHAGIYGIRIYAIMLPPSGFSVAHCCYLLDCGLYHFYDGVWYDLAGA